MSEEIAVSLTYAELQLAATVGAMRQAENLVRKRLDAHRAPVENGWELHIQGAAGEMAFAKWANRFWSGNLGDLDAADVGNAQVRTRSRHNYELILHRRDDDDHAFVLLTGLAPHFFIRGWIWGRDGKREEYWRDPAGGRPAYFVPQSALRHMTRQGVAA